MAIHGTRSSARFAAAFRETGSSTVVEESGTRSLAEAAADALQLLERFPLE